MAEKLFAMANFYKGERVPQAALDGWRTLTLAQHHDCWIVRYNGRPDNRWIEVVAAWTGITNQNSTRVAEQSMLALSEGTGNVKAIRVFNTLVP